MRVVTWINEPDLVFKVQDHTHLLEKYKEWKSNGEVLHGEESDALGGAGSVATGVDF